MRYRTFILLVSLAVDAPLVVACQGDTVFPRCDDPARPCPPVHPDYPTSDRDGLGTTIGDACDRLRRMGCPEGWPNRSGRTCFESYTSASMLAAVPATCITRATTQSEVRSCGDENTVRVRCILPSAIEAGSAAP
jgi:hypothetical protein